MRAVSPVIAAALVAALGAPLAARSLFPEDPPPGHTGGFGERTCLVCHFDNPMNAPEGDLSLQGVPTTYSLGDRYVVTVSVTHPELRTGGFQLSARSADGSQAGTIRAITDRETVRSFEGVSYAFHTRRGSMVEERGRASWRVEWIAPTEARGPIHFHVSANAGNGDESALGDFIFTDSARARVAPSVRK